MIVVVVVMVLGRMTAGSGSVSASVTTLPELGDDRAYLGVPRCDFHGSCFLGSSCVVVAVQVATFK